MSKKRLNPDLTAKLLRALNTGLVLKKLHHNEHYEYFHAEILDDGIWYNRHGWGSACGTKEQVLVELIENPELWEIDKPQTDKPWIH